MIKVKWSRLFSTLRFSEEYRQTFQLSRQMRSCISLQELTAFVQNNDAAIQKYGKTIALQHFNEFPLPFSYRTMKSEIHVFEYVLGLQGLSPYEEQLRYANICKLIEYAPWDAQELQRRAHQQERRILGLAEQQPFDLVDALNWLLFQRAHIGSQLTEQAFHIICSVPIERSESIMAKMLNAFLKKIEDVEWSSLRKFRPIFEFLCYKYEISIQSPKLMVSNLEKLTGLKLHLLGYDCVPKAVNQITARLEDALGSLDMHYLQIAFKCFDNLPAGYNRKLLGLIHSEIISRLDKDILHPNSLPLQRLTRKQIEEMMSAFVGKGMYIRNCIYYINCQESQTFFQSQVFLDALTQEFLRPLRTQDNLNVDYTSYISVGRALLDYYQPADPIRSKIVAQIRQVHQAVKKNQQNINRITQFSLCGWFNLYSLDLELGLMKDRKRLRDAVEAEIRKFMAKKHSSAWKGKKHHQQLRELIKRHANSPFPEIRQLLLTFLRNDLVPLSSTLSFHSNYYPPYIYMLEDSQYVHTYQPLLTSLYSILRGEDAMAFIESYIRAPKKSAKVTLSIMEKLWDINHSPAMMFKLAAGVPLIYFQSGINGILSGVAAILEDAAIFVKGEDLQQLSMGQLTNLIRFCRKFAKKIRIVSHKLLILALGRVSGWKGKAEEMQMQMHMELPMELLALTIEIKYSDSELCISRISELLHSIKEDSLSRPLVLLRLVEAKLMLKASMSIDAAATNQTLRTLIERTAKEEGMAERAKVAVILLKLHAKEEVDLEADYLKLYCDIIKRSLDVEELYPSQLPVLLGSIFIDQCDLVKSSRLKQVKEIFLHSLGAGVEETQFYVYLLSFAYKTRASELIQRSLDHLALQPLEPSFLLLLVNTLKQHTAIFRPEVIDRILKDTAAHFHTLNNQHIHILYYVHTACHQIPPLHQQTCSRMLSEIQMELSAQVKLMLGERSPQKEKLFQLLVNTYKYYWIAIKNKQISQTTLTIFKFNIHHIHQIYEIINFRGLDGISPEIIHMMHLALSPKAFALPDAHQPQNKAKFFTARKDVGNNSKYEEYMVKIGTMINKQPIRSFTLDKQLNDLKIYYKGRKEAPIYFTFGEKKAGIQLHYCIRNGPTHHYIFIMTNKMRNNAGLFKGRVALLQQLYNIILHTEIMIYDENDPLIISFD